MGHIGILGHSWEGAAACWRESCLHSMRLGHPDHPDITMDCISFERAMPAWNSGDYGAVRKILAQSVDRLSRAGCDFFVCADNTAHLALESDGEPLALPGLHLVDLVAEAAVKQEATRVAVLGTRFTMQGPLYPRELAARGLEAVIPDAEDQRMVDSAIFGELVHGVFRQETRAAFVALIARLADAGCDAVALVCTEIPLLVSENDSPLPILDSTRSAGRAAAEVALGLRPLPAWRGSEWRDA